MNAPTQIRQGDSYTWTETDSDHPASTYTGKCYINGPSALTLTAVADGDEYDFEITAAQSAALTVGTYQLQIRTELTAAYTHGVKTIQVIAGGVQSAGYEARNHNRIVLDAINAAIEGRATHAEQAVTIGGKSIQYMTFEEMITAKMKYERFVEADEAADRVNAGLNSGKQVSVRFNNT
jgi:hypothetical protein